MNAAATSLPKQLMLVESKRCWSISNGLWDEEVPYCLHDDVIQRCIQSRTCRVLVWSSTMGFEMGLDYPRQTLHAARPLICAEKLIKQGCQSGDLDASTTLGSLYIGLTTTCACRRRKNAFSGWSSMNSSTHTGRVGK